MEASSCCSARESRQTYLRNLLVLGHRDVMIILESGIAVVRRKGERAREKKSVDVVASSSSSL